MKRFLIVLCIFAAAMGGNLQPHAHQKNNGTGGAPVELPAVLPSTGEGGDGIASTPPPESGAVDEPIIPEEDRSSIWSEYFISLIS